MVAELEGHASRPTKKVRSEEQLTDEQMAESPGPAHAQASGSHTKGQPEHRWPKELAEFILATEKKANEMDLLSHLETVTNPARRLAD